MFSQLETKLRSTHTPILIHISIFFLIATIFIPHTTAVITATANKAYRVASPFMMMKNIEPLERIIIIMAKYSINPLMLLVFSLKLSKPTPPLICCV